MGHARGVALVPKGASNIGCLVVNVIQVLARFTRLLRAAIGENAISVVRPIHTLSFAAWQEPGAFDICVGTALDLVTRKEGHKAYTWVIVADATVTSVVIVKAI